MKALFLIIFCLFFDSPFHRCGEHLERSVMTESSVLRSPGFEMRLSIWEACHKSWVKSKVTGCSKDRASDANCLSTLQRLELPELKVYRMFERSAQQKSSHWLTAIIACTICKRGQVSAACSDRATSLLNSSSARNARDTANSIVSAECPFRERG